MPDPLPPRWAAAATVPLAVVGLGLSAYLTYVHYADPRALSCPDTGVVNCTKVTTSAESLLFGAFPVALAGVVYFAALALLLLPAAWRARARWVAAARLAGAVGGIAMVGYLVYVEAIRLHAICLYCTGVHVVTFLLFVAVLAATLLPDVGGTDEGPRASDGRDRTPAAPARREGASPRAR